MAFSPPVTVKRCKEFVDDLGHFNDTRSKFSTSSSYTVNPPNHPCMTNYCTSYSTAVDDLSDCLITPSENAEEISEMPCLTHRYANSTEEECITHILGTTQIPTSCPPHHIQRHFHSSENGKSEKSLSWINSAICQSSNTATVINTNNVHDDRGNLKNVSLGTTATFNLKGLSTRPSLPGNDVCRLDDLVLKITDDDQFSSSLLQEQAELLGINLNEGLLLNKRNLVSSNLYPKNNSPYEKENDPDYSNYSITANMGYLDKTKQPPNLVQNVSYYSSINRENSGALPLTFAKKNYQVQRNCSENYLHQENSCGYENWGPLNEFQKAENLLNELLSKSEYQFNNTQNNEFAEQQDFWMPAFEKNVSETINVPTHITSLSSIPTSLSSPAQNNHILASSNQLELNDLSRKQEREHANGDIPVMMLNDSQPTNENGFHNNRRFRPISSSSSSSSESQVDLIKSTVSQNSLNIANISEARSSFSTFNHLCNPANNSCIPLKSNMNHINSNGHTNQISQVYQNFPRNFNSHYQNLHKTLLSSQATEDDCASSLCENVASNYIIHNSSINKVQHLNKLQSQKSNLHNSKISSSLCMLQNSDLLKNYVCENTVSVEENYTQEYEKPVLKHINSNKVSLFPEGLQHLSARTIAGLYTFNLCRDVLHADYNNCDRGPLSIQPEMKCHLLNSSSIPESVYEIYHPYNLAHKRGTSSMYGTNDVFFDPASSAFFSVPSTFIGMRPLRRSGPSNELHVRLEECYEQFRHLEKERKKTEAALARQNPGKKISSTNTIPIPRLTVNPSRVDRLIIDELREHSKVITLITKMEQLRKTAIHPNIHSDLEKWLDAIKNVQSRRRDEIINVANRQRSSANRIQEDKDVVALAASITELTKSSRLARTSMWCALTTTTLFNTDPQIASAISSPPDFQENGDISSSDNNAGIVSNGIATYSTKSLDDNNETETGKLCKGIVESATTCSDGKIITKVVAEKILKTLVDMEGASCFDVDKSAS